MKAPSLAVVVCLCAYSLLAQTQNHNVRIINGNNVDVSAVEAWMKHHQGARPMQAWKMIRIDQMLSKMGFCYLCAASIDGAGSGKILLADFPQNMAVQATRSPGMEVIAIATGKAYAGYEIWDCGYDTRDEKLRAVTPAMEKENAKKLAHAGKNPTPAAQVPPAPKIQGGPATPARTSPQAEPAAAPQAEMQPARGVPAQRAQAPQPNRSQRNRPRQAE